MKLVLLFIIDIIAVFNAVVVSFKLSPSFTKEVIIEGAVESSILPIAIGISLSVGLTLYFINSGDSYLRVGRIETTARALIGCVFGTLIFTALYGLANNEMFGRYVFFFSVLLSWLAVAALRVILEQIKMGEVRTIFLVGTPEEHRQLADLIGSSAQGIRIVGVDERLARAGESTGSDSVGDLRQRGVSDLVVGRRVHLSRTEIDQLMACTMEGLNVIDINAFCEKYLRCVFSASIDESWFWQYDSQYLHPVFTLAKRALDILVSLLGLVLALPLAGLVALALKLQDGGPIIYSQMRVGYVGRSFRIYKFRSMRVDAEKHGAQWARKKDARVTWLGRLLRATRFDELPQFWNILRGDMSFIGPRPERPEMIADIEKELEFFRCRTLVKPGLTGWAQINYPYGASLEDAGRKLSYDLYYIKHASVFMDLIIALRTAIAMIKGAR